MNLMTVDGYRAKIEYDEDLDLFRGEILGLNGGADFYGKNSKELRAEFKKSLEVYLEVCKEKGIAAQAEGKSINALAQEALQHRVAS